MKVEKTLEGRRSWSVPPKSQRELVSKLVACESDLEAISCIETITSWHPLGEQANLVSWVPLLNRLDQILERFVTSEILLVPFEKIKESTLSFEEKNRQIETLMTILRFCSLLLQNSRNRGLFLLGDHMVNLLAAKDSRVERMALQVLYVAVWAPQNDRHPDDEEDADVYLEACADSVRKRVKHYLVGYSSGREFHNVIDYLTNEHIDPEEFQFQHVKKSQVLESEDVAYISIKSDDVEDAASTFEQLEKEYAVGNAAAFALLQKVKLAHSLRSKESRVERITMQYMAFIILVYGDIRYVMKFFNNQSEWSRQVASVVMLPDNSIPAELRLVATRALTVIVEACSAVFKNSNMRTDKLTKKSRIMEALGMSQVGSRDSFLSVMRSVLSTLNAKFSDMIKDGPVMEDDLLIGMSVANIMKPNDGGIAPLNPPPPQPPQETFISALPFHDHKWIVSILKLMRAIAGTEVGGAALSDAGIIQSIVSLITLRLESWQTTDNEADLLCEHCNTYVVILANTLEMAIQASPSAVKILKDVNYLHLLVSGIHTVLQIGQSRKAGSELSIRESLTRKDLVYGDFFVGELCLLSSFWSTLNIIDVNHGGTRMGAGGVSDMLREEHSALLESLSFTFDNCGSMYPSMLAHLCALLSDIINSDPRCARIVFESKLAECIIDFVSYRLPNEAETLALVPNLLYSLCLNPDTLKLVSRPSIVGFVAPVEALLDKFVDVVGVISLTQHSAQAIAKTLGSMAHQYANLKPRLLDAVLQVTRKSMETTEFSDVQRRTLIDAGASEFLVFSVYKNRQTMLLVLLLRTLLEVAEIAKEFVAQGGMKLLLHMYLNLLPNASSYLKEKESHTLLYHDASHWLSKPVVYLLGKLRDGAEPVKEHIDFLNEKCQALDFDVDSTLELVEEVSKIDDVESPENPKTEKLSKLLHDFESIRWLCTVLAKCLSHGSGSHRSESSRMRNMISELVSDDNMDLLRSLSNMSRSTLCMIINLQANESGGALYTTVVTELRSFIDAFLKLVRAIGKLCKLPSRARLSFGITRFNQKMSDNLTSVIRSHVDMISSFSGDLAALYTAEVIRVVENIIENDSSAESSLKWNTTLLEMVDATDLFSTLVDAIVNSLFVALSSPNAKMETSVVEPLLLFLTKVVRDATTPKVRNSSSSNRDKPPELEDAMTKFRIALTARVTQALLNQVNIGSEMSPKNLALFFPMLGHMFCQRVPDEDFMRNNDNNNNAPRNRNQGSERARTALLSGIGTLLRGLSFPGHEDMMRMMQHNQESDGFQPDSDVATELQESGYSLARIEEAQQASQSNNPDTILSWLQANPPQSNAADDSGNDEEDLELAIRMSMGEHPNAAAEITANNEATQSNQLRSWQAVIDDTRRIIDEFRSCVFDLVSHILERNDIDEKLVAAVLKDLGVMQASLEHAKLAEWISQLSTDVSGKLQETSSVSPLKLGCLALLITSSSEKLEANEGHEGVENEMRKLFTVVVEKMGQDHDRTVSQTELMVVLLDSLVRGFCKCVDMNLVIELCCRLLNQETSSGILRAVLILVERVADFADPDSNIYTAVRKNLLERLDHTSRFEGYVTVSLLVFERLSEFTEALRYDMIGCLINLMTANQPEMLYDAAMPVHEFYEKTKSIRQRNPQMFSQIVSLCCAVNHRRDVKFQRDFITKLEAFVDAKAEHHVHRYAKEVIFPLCDCLFNQYLRVTEADSSSLLSVGDMLYILWNMVRFQPLIARIILHVRVPTTVVERIKQTWTSVVGGTPPVCVSGKMNILDVLLQGLLVATPQLPSEKSVGLIQHAIQLCVNLTRLNIENSMNTLVESIGRCFAAVASSDYSKSTERVAVMLNWVVAVESLMSLPLDMQHPKQPRDVVENWYSVPVIFSYNLPHAIISAMEKVHLDHRLSASLVSRTMRILLKMSSKKIVAKVLSKRYRLTGRNKTRGNSIASRGSGSTTMAYAMFRDFQTHMIVPTDPTEAHDDDEDMDTDPLAATYEEASIFDGYSEMEESESESSLPSAAMEDASEEEEDLHHEDAEGHIENMEDDDGPDENELDGDEDEDDAEDDEEEEEEEEEETGADHLDETPHSVATTIVADGDESDLEESDVNEDVDINEEEDEDSEREEVSLGGPIIYHRHRFDVDDEESSVDSDEQDSFQMFQGFGGMHQGFRRMVRQSLFEDGDDGDDGDDPESGQLEAVRLAQRFSRAIRAFENHGHGQINIRIQRIGRHERGHDMRRGRNDGAADVAFRLLQRSNNRSDRRRQSGSRFRPEWFSETLRIMSSDRSQGTEPEIVENENISGHVEYDNALQHPVLRGAIAASARRNEDDTEQSENRHRDIGNLDRFMERRIRPRNPRPMEMYHGSWRDRIQMWSNSRTSRPVDDLSEDEFLAVLPEVTPEDTRTDSEAAPTNVVTSESQNTEEDDGPTVEDLGNSMEESQDIEMQPRLEVSTFRDVAIAAEESAAMSAEDHAVTGSLPAMADQAAARPPPPPSSASEENDTPSAEPSTVVEASTEQVQEPSAAPSGYSPNLEGEHEFTAEPPVEETGSSGHAAAVTLPRPDDVDAEVWADLPDDIRLEILAQRGIHVNQVDNSAEDDFLAAMPEEIRQEILQQQRESQHVAETEQAADIANAEEMDNASFIASLEPELRNQILLDLVQSGNTTVISSLPQHLRIEAELLRTRHNAGRTDAYRAHEEGEAEGSVEAKADSPTTVTLRSEIHCKPFLAATDMRQIATWFFLVTPPPDISRCLAHLCEYSKLRHWLIDTILYVVHPQVRNSDNWLPDSIIGPLEDGYESAPKSIDCGDGTMLPPLLVCTRMFNLLTELCHRNTSVTLLFLVSGSSSALNIFEANPHFAKKLHKRPACLESIIELLEVEPYRNSMVQLQNIIMLLKQILAPLSKLPKQSLKAPEVEEETVSASEDHMETLESEPANPPQVEVNEDAPSKNEHASRAQQVQIPYRVVDEVHLRQVANVLCMDTCTDAIFLETTKLIQLLAVVTENRQFLRKELCRVAEVLGGRCVEQLQVLLQILQENHRTQGLYSHSSVFSSTPEEVKLLRVLSTLPNLKENDDQVENLFSELQLGTLWRIVSSALESVAFELKNKSITHGYGHDAQHPLRSAPKPVGDEEENPSHTSSANSIAIAFAHARLPMIKTFFLVHGNLSNASEETELVDFVQKNAGVINALVSQSPGLLEDSFEALVKNPKCRFVIDFANKRQYFRNAMKKLRHTRNMNAPIKLRIRRSHVFEDSFASFSHYQARELLCGKLSVIFDQEEGVDAGGVTREWYEILAREIFKPDYALFKPSADSSAFQPDARSHIISNHLDYFKFIGRVVGKSLADGHLMDAHFTRSFYKHILGLKVTPQDMQSLDPVYYNSLMELMKMDIDDVGLELSFTVDTEEFGKVTTHELKPNGTNIMVTEANKKEYVRLVTEYRMSAGIRAQIDSFLEGFHDLIPGELIQIFDENELELVISGIPHINILDLKDNTEYTAYNLTSPQIRWFWELLESWPQEDLAKFLMFITGTSKVPLEGFKALVGMRGPQKFSIHKAYGGDSTLPTSHTCFNQLDLPEYSTKEILVEKLSYAVLEGGEGFGFA